MRSFESYKTIVEGGLHQVNRQGTAPQIRRSILSKRHRHPTAHQMFRIQHLKPWSHSWQLKLFRNDYSGDQISSVTGFPLSVSSA